MVIISLMILIIAIALRPYTNSNNSNIQFVSGISPILITRLTSIIFLFSGALAYNALYIQSIGSGLSIYSGLFQVTSLSQSFDVIIFILGSLILIPWYNNIPQINSLKDKLVSYISGPITPEYSLICLFSALGSSLILSSGNLLSMYLAIELQSFGVYILATIYRNSESSTNAGLKYFLLGGLSSCLILLGCALIYSYTGTIYFEDIYSLLISINGQHINSTSDIATTIQLGLVLVFIGFLFKIAGAPFHNWAPDVYNDTPTIVTTWLTIMPKIAIVVLSFELISSINLDVLRVENVNLIKNLLLISSFLSLMIGTIVGLSQIKIKRLLAYSTISHVGFMLLALSVNTEESLESLLFYLVQYSFTNLNTFFIILSFGYIIKKSLNNPYVSYKEGNNQDINLIKELKGQFFSNPLLSLSLAICLFSMAGIPPLVGFFAKAQVLYSAINNGYYFISLVAIIVSVISAYYYLQIIRVMHFDKNNNTLEEGFFGETYSIRYNPSNLNKNLHISNLHSYIISLLTLSLVLFILKPSILLNSIHLVALNVFYT